LLRKARSAKEQIAILEGTISIIRNELRNRMEPAARTAWGNKTHGSKVVDFPNGMAVKVELDRKVSWDTDKLLELAAEENWSWAKFQVMYKIELSVPAAIMTGVEASDPKLYAKLDACRTIRYGNLKLGVIDDMGVPV
jgi:hypothetical protein